MRKERERGRREREEGGGGREGYTHSHFDRLKLE